MKRVVVLLGGLAITLLSACAPAAAPTPEVMMANSSPTAAAMMTNVTPTADAMMANSSPTAAAMMTNGSPTPAAMMANVTPTSDAMMAKPTSTADAMMPGSTAMDKMPDQMASMHFVESSPKQGIVLSKAPAQVQITFNAALSDTSTVSVVKDGVALKTGKLVLGEKMLSMSVTLPNDVTDGIYLVKYKACWAGGTCDDGQFGFKVDSKMGM